jgi:hypothetical protein
VSALAPTTAAAAPPKLYGKSVIISYTNMNSTRTLRRSTIRFCGGSSVSLARSFFADLLADITFRLTGFFADFDEGVFGIC